MPFNPYPLDREERPQLKNSIVLIADVLGFSNLVMESFENGTLDSTLGRVWEALVPRLRRLNEPSVPQLGRPFELKVFTDNVVIGWPIQHGGEAEFGSVVMVAAYYQLELALDGLFVRGAMDIGPAYIDRYFAFGPPVIASHQLETNKARYPRIVLSEKLEALICKYLQYYADPLQSGVNSELLRDADGMLFIDYLNVVITGADTIDFTEVRELLLRHGQSIVQQVGKHTTESTVKDKFQWAANYHNYVVEHYFGKDTGLMVPTTGSFGSPSRLLP
jgi:hypothetical protein